MLCADVALKSKHHCIKILHMDGGAYVYSVLGNFPFKLRLANEKKIGKGVTLMLWVTESELLSSAFFLLLHLLLWYWGLFYT